MIFHSYVNVYQRVSPKKKTSEEISSAMKGAEGYPPVVVKMISCSDATIYHIPYTIYHNKTRVYNTMIYYIDISGMT